MGLRSPIFFKKIFYDEVNVKQKKEKSADIYYSRITHTHTHTHTYTHTHIPGATLRRVTFCSRDSRSTKPPIRWGGGGRYLCGGIFSFHNVLWGRLLTGKYCM